MTVWFLVAAAVLLIANGFFVAVEFALLASRASRLAPMVESGDAPGAAAALQAVRDLQPQLAGAQLGITMASLGLGFGAEPAVAHLIESGIGDRPPAVRGAPHGVVRRGPEHRGHPSHGDR
ncbi:MAG: CNNM domain-containing protein [Acidimicrobiales bacterium]